MLLQRIQQQFIDSADLKYQCAQAIAPAVENAIQAVLASVTGGGKVLACGNGASAAAAQHFAASFIGRYERERPELAALSLSADAAVLSGLANDFDARAVYSRQVRALGHAGDVLLALSTTGNSANMLAAVEAAHEREMTVVALTGGRGGRLAQMLRDTDVHVCVPHELPARILEVHHLVLHCICDGVDAQLLGLPDSPIPEQADRRTSGAQLEDQGIELRSANRLRDQLGERGNVSVTSYNRVALLTGEVPTEADKAAVEKTVAGVDNVRSVVNELAVLGAASLSQRSSDALVTGRVKAAMVEAKDLSANAFKVVTSRGTVYLMGRVTQREADRATEITRNTSGVQRVVRVLETITEQELAAMQPQPAPAPVKDATPAK